MSMRLSAIQKDVLFVLYALEEKGHRGTVQGMKLLGLINGQRMAEIHGSNFRISCNTLVGHSLLNRYRNSSLQLAFTLTEKGREVGAELYLQRTAELASSTAQTVKQNQVENRFQGK